MHGAKEAAVLALFFEARLLCWMRRLCVGIWKGLEGNGWAVLGSLLWSPGILLMSRDWTHPLCLLICFCSTVASPPVLNWIFLFVTSSGSDPSVYFSFCFDQSCEIHTTRIQVIILSQNGQDKLLFKMLILLFLIFTQIKWNEWNRRLDKNKRTTVSIFQNSCFFV